MRTRNPPLQTYTRSGLRAGHVTGPYVLLLSVMLGALPAVVSLGHSAHAVVAGGSNTRVSVEDAPSVGSRSLAGVHAALAGIARRAQDFARATTGVHARATDKLSKSRLGQPKNRFRRRPLPSTQQLQQRYDNVIAWPGYKNLPVNPIADWENCAACSIALDFTLGGAPSQALPYTRYAERMSPDVRIASLLKRRDRFADVVRGLDEVLAESLDERLTALRPELGKVRKQPSLLKTASPELQEQVLLSDLFSYHDQSDFIARSVGRTDDDWKDFTTARDAFNAASRWPDRSKGIVWVDTGLGYAHVFNVLRYKNKTILMDGQIGAGYRRGVYDASPLASLLRTDKVPASVDLDAMRLPKGIEEVNDLD